MTPPADGDPVKTKAYKRLFADAGLTLRDLNRCASLLAPGVRCTQHRKENWTTCSYHFDEGQPDEGFCETKLGQLCTRLLRDIAHPLPLGEEST